MMFNQFQNRQPQPMAQTNPIGNIQYIQQQMQMIQNQLTSAGKSPEEMVRSLMANGQMSQEQFMQYSQIANMIFGGLR